MLIVFTTTPSRDEARKLARLAVERKLAACVQIIPAIESVFEWKGEIASETEALLLFKTDARNYNGLEKLLESEHSYDVPEIVAVPSEKIGTGYSKWLDEVLK